MFHIADLHIHPAKHAAIRETWNEFYQIIKTTPDACLIIAGDVFEYKNKLYDGDINLFNKILQDLEAGKIPTAIIPGNHDFNGSGICMLGNLLQNKNFTHIYYFENSGTFPWIKSGGKQIYLHIFSPFDKKKPEQPPLKNPAQVHVALVHEPIQGVIPGEFRFKTRDFCNFDLTLLGDIHKPQFLTPQMAYAGSFVQKNQSEGLEHGYIKWNLQKLSGEFFNLTQYFADIRGSPENTLTSAKNINIVRPNSVIIENPGRLEKPAEKELIKVFGRVDNFVDISPAPEILFDETEFIREMSGEFFNEIMKIHREYMISTPKRKFTLKYLKWKGVFKYVRESHIDFSKLSGICTMVGRNASGKSSIISILIAILFGGRKSLSLPIASKLILSKTGPEVLQQDGHIACGLEFNGDFYEIYRQYHRSGKGDKYILYKNSAVFENGDITKTRSVIEDIVGSRDDFTSIPVALQFRPCILDMTSAGRYEFFMRISGITELAEKNKENSRAITELKAELKSRPAKPIPTTDLPEKISAVESQLAELPEIPRPRKIPEPAVFNLPEIPEKLCAIIEKNLELDEKLADFPAIKSEVDWNLVSTYLEFYHEAKHLSAFFTKPLSSKKFPATREFIAAKLLEIREFLKTPVPTPAAKPRVDASEFPDFLPPGHVGKFVEVTVRSPPAPVLPPPEIPSQTPATPEQVSRVSEHLRSSLKAAEETIRGWMHLIPKSLYPDYLVFANSIEKLDKLREQQRQYELFVKYQQDLAEYEAAAAVTIKLRQQNTIYEKYLQRLEYDAWKKYSEWQKKSAEFSEFLFEIVNYPGYSAARFWINTFKTFRAEKNLIAEYSENLRQHEIFNKTEETRKCLRKKLADLNIEFGRVSREISEAAETLEFRRPRIERLNLLTLYDKILDEKTGLLHKLLQKKITCIEKTWNRELSKVANISVKFDLTDGLNIYICENNNLISAEACSGFQKTILDLTLRVCLNDYSFFIIDEILHSSDATNSVIVKNYLESISDKFNFVLNISHNENFIIGQKLFINSTPAGSSITVGDCPKFSFNEKVFTLTDGPSKKTQITEYEINEAGFYCNICKAQYKLVSLIPKHVGSKIHQINRLKF